jgi:hypothetical protein
MSQKNNPFSLFLRPYIWLHLSSFAHYKLDDEVVTKGVEGLYNIQFIRLLDTLGWFKFGKCEL